VYDDVGQANYEKSLDSLAPRGVLVLFVQASGPVPPFDTAVLNAKGSVSLSRPSLTHNVTNNAEVLQRAGDLFTWIGARRLNVTIGNVFGLSEAAQAHRALESRQSVGKILLIP
jgi:NADPH2:quinone reductase